MNHFSSYSAQPGSCSIANIEIVKRGAAAGGDAAKKVMVKFGNWPDRPSTRRDKFAHHASDVPSSQQMNMEQGHSAGDC